MMRFIGEPISQQEIDDILDEADKDENGLIDYKEFADMMTPGRGAGHGRSWSITVLLLNNTIYNIYIDHKYRIIIIITDLDRYDDADLKFKPLAQPNPLQSSVSNKILKLVVCDNCRVKWIKPHKSN